MREGDMVRLAQVSHQGTQVGDEGMVIMSSGNAVHVKWRTGAWANAITMCSPEDFEVVPSPVQASALGSLLFVDDVPSYDGSNQAPHEQHLSDLSLDVRAFVAAKVESDPALRQAKMEIGEEAIVTMVLKEASGDA